MSTVRLSMSFDIDNDAFYDDDGELIDNAISPVIHDVARKVHDGQTGGRLRDVNGNTIGKWKMTTT
jgi:hypothetical protein